ncbi:MULTISPECIES: carboxylesterase/lipase family protein [Paraburkholderia]|uniref:carboxylesterase/lipase family protein n=1 Tax=Paraburkholderia TaxID=1822464 RepID=UPI0022516C5C|nr:MULTISPECIES: carboxylesterase family protein [Paraburkholderia]MCX4163035.1 carboxylesterase family protein [Paraburkholderia megapolitana]MDN7158531.1 carboxylesterase family protein [Paraburkholderia sp. CHISQ3]MDQ6495578.1 carboxylesterase family protein [Paraburkholderia megapolitana]
MTSIRRAAAVLLAIASVLSPIACSGGINSVPPTRRDTSFGAVEGVNRSTTTGTYEWLGVPYAQPPVGALRWMPPVDPAPWSSVRATQQFGHSCAQGGRYFSPAPNDAPYGLAVREGFGKPVGDEDCLTLNIWTPANAQGKLPVIFFIHGGSNISGYSADPVYNGQALARKANAVVVTINYRLGIFGWLDLPQLKTGNTLADSGDFALLDQQQALKFVKNNIAAFGGDPTNVTVMGQSAGAVNVWALLVSPLSAGLFQKAIPLSGGIVNASRPTAQTYSKALLNAIVIADGKATDAASAQATLATQTDVQVATYLRGLPAAQLLTVMLANPQLGTTPAPIEDGNVLPVNSIGALAFGQYQKVPVLAGNTRDEGTLFAGLFGSITGTGISGFKPSDYDRFGLQFNFNPNAPTALSQSDLINAAYLPVTAFPFGWNALTVFTTNTVFLAPVAPQLTSLALQQPGKVWYYRFDWDEEPAPFNTVYGATHAMDLPFIFSNFGPNVFSFAYSNANQPGREALSDAMIASVAAFARTGNPNTPALGVTWANFPAKVVMDASPTQLRITAQ